MENEAGEKDKGLEWVVNVIQLVTQEDLLGRGAFQQKLHEEGTRLG